MDDRDTDAFVAAVDKYRREQLAQIAFEPRHHRAFVTAVLAGLDGQGYTQRGRTLVWEGPDGQIGELRLHAPPPISPSPAALRINMMVLQRLCPGEGKVPDHARHTVTYEVFDPTRPMTGLYWSAEATTAEYALVAPGAPGQDELIAGVVEFGQRWAQALADTELFVQRMEAARPSFNSLTVRQYRRLRALTAGGDLSRLQTAYDVLEASIPPNPWGAYGASLAEIIHTAWKAADAEVPPPQEEGRA